MIEINGVGESSLIRLLIGLKLQKSVIVWKN